MAERISFTRPSAERIANAVRVVEQARPDAAPLAFRQQPASVGARVFRTATFTGAWAINTTKTVTLRTANQTVAAVNIFAAIASSNSTRNCGIAREGTAWYLIAAQC